MKNLGKITDPKDIITKEFLEEGIGTRVNTLEDNVAMAESDIETLQGDVQSLQTDNTATKAAVKTLQDTYVPNTRKINNKALDADITLTAGNVGTVPATWTRINDGVDGLSFPGSPLGGNVELGFLNDEDGCYYGLYQQNAYIRALNNGAIEVSAEPTTELGIVNKKFLELELDKFWARNKPTTHQNVTVPTSAWVANTNSQAADQEKTDYPFMATISLTGVSANQMATVLFNYDDQIGGNFAPCAYTTSGGVIIEAKEKPTATITLASVTIMNVDVK